MAALAALAGRLSRPLARIAGMTPESPQDGPPPKKSFSLRKPSVTEVVGVAALVIAALGYWDSHRERVQQDSERVQAERQRKSAEADQGKARAQEALKHALLLTGVPAGEELRLQSSRGEQVIQTQTLWFPSEVRAASVATTGNPRIEARWVEGKLRRAAKPEDHQLPVGIETSFIEDGQRRTDRSIYLIGFNLHGRLVGGAKLEFEGLSLAQRDVRGDLQAAANAAWSQQHPTQDPPH
jgi:hypothetical protein